MGRALRAGLLLRGRPRALVSRHDDVLDDGRAAPRRRLVLRIHRWIAERVLAPIARGEDPVVADLEADGALTATLIYMIPPRKLDAWRFWIFLALADLRLALAQPPMLRDEAWARRLFLIPYSIPLRRGVGRMQGDTYA